MDEEDGESYGLGVYRVEADGRLFYYAMGVDTGVDFFTAFFPQGEIVVSALGNTGLNTFGLLEECLEILP